MINVLIADDNIDFAINLMNYINEKNENIKVCNISKDGKETIEILNSKSNIDIILLDYKMPFYNAKQILEKINNREKYFDSCIIISGEIELVNELIDNEIVHSIIYKTIDMDEIVKRINELFFYKELVKESRMLKNKIKEEVLYLKYDISHKGTQYLIETIQYIAINQKKDFQNLQRDIYPKIANRYGETTHNIKCRINRATNAMYCNCEIERLKEYFNFSIDTKPKIRTIIDTIINKVS